MLRKIILAFGLITCLADVSSCDKDDDDDDNNSNTWPSAHWMPMEKDLLKQSILCQHPHLRSRGGEVRSQLTKQ